MRDILRIANASGFYGDRPSAAREMVEGGPIDVLTGDYLAELTMAILHKSRERRPGTGWATTFLRQLEEVLGACLDRGIRVVSNAGGLNPEGLAHEIEALCQRLGLSATIAWVTGDDLLDRLPGWLAQGEELRHCDTGQALSALDVVPLTANAYLGGFGIAEALRRGADVVVCPRVTDASLVVGPGIWAFDWGPGDWDALAGAVVAGHVIECGTQCTGGNYAFFQEIPGLEAPGFPIAELAGDGSSVITKHPGTGGQVSLGTVTAQLLYEISGPRYPNPDVTARFDSIRLESQGPDRVRISAVVGEPPPPDTKVCINYLGGYRNSVTFLLAGLDVEAKARLAERTLCERLGGRERFAEVDVRLLPGAADRAPSAESGLSRLKVTVKDPDPDKVGRAFSNEAVAMTLASYPGFVSTPPSSASSYAVFWPTLVPNAVVEHAVVVKGERVPIAPPPATRPLGPVVPAGPGRPAPAPDTPPRPPRMEALGRVVGARSGDKGGNANVGLWARSAPAFAWLRRFLDVPRFRELIPEARELPVERFELANLWAVNFVVVGLLGEGVASSTREDPQAKALGEILRAQVVPIPVDLLDPASEATVERRSSRQERGAP